LSGHGSLSLACALQFQQFVSGARSHTELITWQLSNELKLAVYELIRSTPLARDSVLSDQLRRSASAAPRNVAEGFGRYLPGEFMRHLRTANGELKETFDALQDAVDRGLVDKESVVPLQRLSRRASKAASNLIAYLRTADAPNEPRTRTGRKRPRGL
jgi:four helix bundle protein